MSNYVILQQSTGVDLTGGFNNSYYGTGSSSNPSLSKTNNLYQWRASFNAEYNAPSVHSFPKILANDLKLLQKYKKIRITYYVAQYSPRAYSDQGMACFFSNAKGENLGTIFYAKLKQSGSTSTSGTAEIEIPKGATQIYFDVNANNDDNPSNVTCQVSDITLVEKRVSAKLGETDVSEVYLGTTEISELFLGDRGL